MTNINVETKGPKGVQLKETLSVASATGVLRGLAVVYGSDQYHAALPGAAAVPCIGLVEEDAISGLPISVIEFGQTVAQIGATVALSQALTNNAAGQLVPAQPGQPVVAIALSANPNAGDYITVLVVAPFGITLKGESVTYYTAAGAIPAAGGTASINGAAALAMTLAQPIAAQDGTILFITAQTAHAHTITTAANGINGTKHVATFASEGDGLVLEAINQVWVVRALTGGTTLA